MIYSLPVEKHVIAGCLKYPKSFYEIDSFVTEKDFYHDIHSVIFSVIKSSIAHGEDKKIALRNIRRDALDDFKKNEKELGASKDQVHGFGDIVQKITDEFVTKVDQMVEVKEKDLMKI